MEEHFLILGLYVVRPGSTMEAPGVVGVFPRFGGVVVCSFGWKPCFRRGSTMLATMTATCVIYLLRGITGYLVHNHPSRGHVLVVKGYLFRWCCMPCRLFFLSPSYPHKLGEYLCIFSIISIKWAVYLAFTSKDIQ